ncbi:MAG: endonuclease/exonuclease/phosphatase family protein [Verrucomicrobiota bacterium]|nr:endonuclease/exonuclease/phosphatase family protein [Verrucomicrobiota bacterium]
MSSLRVITFNMQYGQTWDPANPDDAPVVLQHTIDEIARLDADVVLLQEVERVEPAKGQIEPPPNFSQIKAALPQYHSFFSYPCKDARELPFGYGLAILCKTPLYGTEVIDLPAPAISFNFMGTMTSPTKRVLIGAKTMIAGKEIQLYNTHLQAFFIIEYSSDNHSEQRESVALALRQSKLPTILGGDLNTAPGECTVAHLEAAGYKTAQRACITWKRMPYVLDHLFYNKPFVLEASEIISTTASDHDILLAQLSLK